jgi:lysophospholipase L1-like esterase
MGETGQADAGFEAGSAQRVDTDSARADTADGGIGGAVEHDGATPEQREPRADASSRPGVQADSGLVPVDDGGRGGDARAPALTDLTIFIAGDSTVANYRDTGNERDQAGWGQMLRAHFDERVTIDNRAVGGATSRHFIEDGRLDAIIEAMKPGDVMLVQFGTNDGNRTASYDFQGMKVPYYLDPATSFKSYLSQYVERARGTGATPIFVTPPPRNSAYCVGGNGPGAHAEAMRELGTKLGVPVLDLNKKAVAHLAAICPAPVPEDFFLLRTDGSVDGTHFQRRGARVLAGFVADAMREAKLSLAERLREVVEP